MIIIKAFVMLVITSVNKVLLFNKYGKFIAK